MASYEFLCHREILSLANVWIIRFCVERSVVRMDTVEWNLMMLRDKITFFWCLSPYT